MRTAHAAVTERRENVLSVDFAFYSRAARKAEAYAFYKRASEIDEDPACYNEAIALYRRALVLDPTYAIAMTNMGNIRFRQKDEEGAERLYREALAIDANQPEAHYNLGYVMLERGYATRAAEHFREALAIDPRFADAAFNLGMALAALHDDDGARAAFVRHLELEPAGKWADIARDEIAALGARRMVQRAETLAKKPPRARAKRSQLTLYTPKGAP